MAEKKSSLGLSENMTAALAYLLGWVTGLVVYLMEKDNKNLRFHALQSIVFFGLVTVIHILLGGFYYTWMLVELVNVVALVVWVVCLVKAYQGETFEIPVVADIVKKQLK